MDREENGLCTEARLGGRSGVMEAKNGGFE